MSKQIICTECESTWSERKSYSQCPDCGSPAWVYEEDLDELEPKDLTELIQ